ncbi:ABC transporter substrate-binding protein [candidate division GN15 bacterium]|nr:ABC transporter substrate-binding protein [candidate division GN15 bacterium]
MRIVSLIASATEIVHELGLGRYQVGRSHECDYPPEVKRLPQVTEPKFEPDGTSYEIDQRVKAILQEGLSVYRVHADKLDALKPDVIITQSQCAVCAVSEMDVEEAVRQMVSSKPKIVSLEPNTLDDIFNDIQKVAEALDVLTDGLRLTATLRRRMDIIAEAARKVEREPRVACIEWIEPLMVAGNWMPTLVEMAGGENLFGEAGRHSPMIEWGTIREADPDILFVCPCGYSNEQTLAEMPSLSQLPGYADLTAVKNNRVIVADGNRFFNRPGPRVVESLEILAEIFHPDRFQFNHEGTGWLRYRETTDKNR